MADQSTDLIKGSIYKSILWFSIPLLIGNLFQQLYNTVDSYVVGNYVNSNALAAVGASTPVINMLVGFFMGLATGAGVVISQYFGARRIEKMQRAVHSSLALTGVLCVVFTVVGLLCTQPLLKAIGVHCTVPAFGDNSGELSVPNIHKANAIETLINYLGIERKNTYAFGDGMNDKEMLEYVNIGIAVGNAKEGLKAVADEITDNIDNNGIYNSMKKHNLI